MLVAAAVSRSGGGGGGHFKSYKRPPSATATGRPDSIIIISSNLCSSKKSTNNYYNNNNEFNTTVQCCPLVHTSNIYVAEEIEALELGEGRQPKGPHIPLSGRRNNTHARTTKNEFDQQGSRLCIELEAKNCHLWLTPPPRR